MYDQKWITLYTLENKDHCSTESCVRGGKFPIKEISDIRFATIIAVWLGEHGNPKIKIKRAPISEAVINK